MLRVKQILKEKGITAKELASRLGMNESGLSQSLSGNPTMNRLKDIAKALDVPISSLFSDSIGEGTFTCECGRKYKISEIKG